MLLLQLLKLSRITFGMSKQENTHLATQSSHQASEGSTIAGGGSLLGSICHMHIHLLAMQGLGPLTALNLPSCKGCLSKPPLHAEMTIQLRVRLLISCLVRGFVMLLECVVLVPAVQAEEECNRSRT